MIIDIVKIIQKEYWKIIKDYQENRYFSIKT